MRVDILTLFPGAFSGPLDESIIKRARERGFVEINIINFREYSRDKHAKVDDRPFGGGPGMVLKPEPLFNCVETIMTPGARVIMTTPQGRPFNQGIARELAKEKHIILICGSYEGIDERIREALVNDEISIGDYVLTNGSLPAMVIVDCFTRLIPGVLGDEESAHFESFTENLLDYPHYTRPVEFQGIRVPEILLSGNHKAIAEWRLAKSIERTKKVRPDLFELYSGNKKDEIDRD